MQQQTLKVACWWGGHWGVPFAGPRGCTTGTTFPVLPWNATCAAGRHTGNTQRGCSCPCQAHYHCFQRIKPFLNHFFSFFALMRRLVPRSSLHKKQSETWQSSSVCSPIAFRAFDWERPEPLCLTRVDPASGMGRTWGQGQGLLCAMPQDVPPSGGA